MTIYNNCKTICENSQNEELIIRENDELRLLYTKVNDTDLDNQCNGIIFDAKNQIVCSNFNKFYPLGDDNDDNLDLSNAIFEYCEDGSVIRLYHYNDEWHIATTRNIKSTKNMVEYKSFAEMFYEIFDKKYLKDLDTSCTWLFILRHTENRLVVKHATNSLVFIGAINNATQEILNDYNTPVFESDPLIFPKMIINYQGQDLEEFSRDDKRGILVRIDNKVYQYDFEYFKKVVSLRGNTRSIVQRIIELLDEPDKLKELLAFYPESFFALDIVNHCVSRLVQQIYTLYVESHIRHSVYITRHHPQYRTLSQLHARYRQNNTPITLDFVTDHIRSLDTGVIYKLLGWVY